MSDHGLTDLRTWDWPTLAMQAHADADEAERKAIATAELATCFVGRNEAVRRGFRNGAAALGASSKDHRRLALLAEICGRHADQIPAILEALEAGREVVVVQSRASELVRPRSVVPVRREPGAVRRMLSGLALPAMPRREAH